MNHGMLRTLVLPLGAALAALVGGCNDSPTASDQEKREIHVEVFPWIEGVTMPLSVSVLSSEDPEGLKRTLPPPTIPSITADALGADSWWAPATADWIVLGVWYPQELAETPWPWVDFDFAGVPLASVTSLSQSGGRICLNPIGMLISSRAFHRSYGEPDKTIDEQIDEAEQELLRAFGLLEENVPARAFTEACFSDGDTPQTRWMVALSAVYLHALTKASDSKNPAYASVREQAMRFVDTGYISRTGRKAIFELASSLAAAGLYEGLVNHVSYADPDAEVPDFVAEFDQIIEALEAQVLADAVFAADATLTGDSEFLP